MNDSTPWIDPELVAAGALLQSRGLVAPDRTQASLNEVRAATDRIGAFLGEGSIPLNCERDLSLPGPHGQVPCRLYLPDNADRPPLLIYAHGGGFVQGSLPSWDAMLRDLVRQSGVAALSVDYRLSPEHRFPVAFDEMVAMIRLASREGSGFGIDPLRLAVGGDSAGANLALATSLALRDAGERALGFMLLVYGVYSTDTESESWQRFGKGIGLSQTQMRWIWETYLEQPGQQGDWRAAPALAELGRPAPGTSDRRQPRPTARRQSPSRRAPRRGWRAMQADRLRGHKPRLYPLRPIDRHRPPRARRLCHGIARRVGRSPPLALGLSCRGPVCAASGARFWRVARRGPERGSD
jgi:acetyl esterase